ncbi:hypothetical protein DU508_14445 [Pedobacter chinensis]|uniref:Uncharacterized protein n=1 Tax=Pedobacter chinensis TaxID=2282421 RepID=A0A369PSJ1_9SPHI|nr:hypothetical protein [Pedobacter chinensis]RDC55484.1 hypothetical protein DU508_14445 [Pedobacter chinensis]
MTTLTVQVDNKENAVLLEKILKEMSFVEKVDVNIDTPNIVEEPKGSYQKLKKAIDKTDKSLMFQDIDDPSKWQKDIRDEW